MGNDCASSNSNNLYQKQMNSINVNELKNQWSTIKSFKIKRMFEKSAQKIETSKNELKISFEDFCELFPEFVRYEAMQKKRIYEIFDRENRGYVSWPDFYNSISICYFAQQSTLATIMFMIFDEHLQKTLTKDQLTLLLDLNASYLKDMSGWGSNGQLEPEEIADDLLKGSKVIKLSEWLQRSPQFIDFNQFRRLFNIFREEKLEKQLVQNFSEWNELYDIDKERYISYIISFKWFEAWKVYVEMEYGIWFNVEQKNPVTMKSIKTKKSLKTNNSNKSRRNITENNTTIKRMRVEAPGLSYAQKSKQTIEQVKNYDMIRSIIGERPKQIYNYFLEGEYAGTFRAGLVQNRDYVFVSEKVWNYLNEIYNGWPEFRRTGSDQIELYPKIIRIYSGMFKAEIDYSSEVFREVSKNTAVADLMKKGIELEESELENVSVYYRTFGMACWEPVLDFGDTLNQITQNPLILLIYLPKNSRDDKDFRAKYLVISKNIKQANLGDTLVYQDHENNIKENVMFFSKTIQGKYVIHFIGQSYTNDMCLSEKQFLKKCKILDKAEQGQLWSQNNSKATKIDKKRRGIEDIKNLSFIVSTIIHFLENKNFKDSVIQLSNQIAKTNSQKSNRSLSIILAYIAQRLHNNIHVEPKDILLIVEMFFPTFYNFDITLISSFITEFTLRLKEEACIFKIPNVIRSEYEFSMLTKVTCPKCGGCVEELETNKYSLQIQIPEPLEAYFTVIFVPFCTSVNSLVIKRYGFQLRKAATLKQYKKKVAEVAELGHKAFILVEIESNTIIKNYSHVRDQTATLEQLHLREEDNIYAFQLCTNFSSFVKNHFSFSDKSSLDIENRELKVGDMIDYRTPDKGWISGRIVEKEITTYTYQQNFVVTHRHNNNNHNECSHSVMRNAIAYFPSQSYKNCEIFHLKLIQRFYSEANNSMNNCNMPLIIALPSWMRVKEFQYLVHLQVRRFIKPHYDFQDERESTNLIGSTTLQKSIIRETNKIKIKKFKEYLYGKNLPYKLSFMDRDGHCLICYKQVKSVVNKGEFSEYCTGCPLNPDEPIHWQLIVNDLTIGVDWRSPWCFKTTDIIRNHSSFANLSGRKKKQVETVQTCLNRTMYQTKVRTSMLCCNMPVDAVTTRSIPTLPQNLIICLERMVEEDGFKRAVTRPVSFGDEKIVLQGEEYNLVGVTVSKGHQNNINYNAYVKDDKGQERSRWLLYNGQKVEVIRKQEINKRCTQVLFYERSRAENGQKGPVQPRVSSEEQDCAEMQNPQSQFSEGMKLDNEDDIEIRDFSIKYEQFSDYGTDQEINNKY